MRTARLNRADEENPRLESPVSTWQQGGHKVCKTLFSLHAPRLGDFSHWKGEEEPVLGSDHERLASLENGQLFWHNLAEQTPPGWGKHIKNGATARAVAGEAQGSPEGRGTC